jgi:hypothetical protein
MFLITFAISIVVARAFETFLSCDTMISANHWQQRLYGSVSAMAPVALATGYIDDALYLARGGSFARQAERPSSLQAPTQVALLPACQASCERSQGTSDDGHAAPVPGTGAPTANGLTPLEKLDAVDGITVLDRDEACRSLNLLTYCELFSEGYGECMARANELKENYGYDCEGWEDPRLRAIIDAREHPVIEYTPPGGEKRGMGHILSAPLGALLLTWGRLTATGGWSYVWAILQLAVGFLAYLLVHAYVLADPKDRGRLPVGLWAWVLGVPIGSVLCASGIAFILKYLMLGGLAAFGWFTCFAATACAAVGVAGTCWFYAVKLAEHAAQSAAAVD